HVIYDVPEGQKLPALRVLLDGREEQSVLVFGRTKHGVKKLARQLSALGYPAAALQGNLSQNARDAVMADFRSGSVPILLATNVAARGLDVEHIGLVINFELPESTELLTHRVGRTGRMGREGDAVTLLVPSDEAKWRQLSRSLKQRIPRKPWTAGLPSVPAHIEAFPLYPKESPVNQRTAVGRASSPASADRQATIGRASSPAPADRQATVRRASSPRHAASTLGEPRTGDNGRADVPGGTAPQAPPLKDSVRAERPDRFDHLPRPRYGRDARPSSGKSFFDTLAEMEREDHGQHGDAANDRGKPTDEAARTFSRRRGRRRSGGDQFRRASA
ncbi:MAG: hypothetical protein KGJ86_23440, partial [Chloroflexota bacterium]|nr:hypothetical protein [Chloroflexota bacterium]